MAPPLYNWLKTRSAGVLLHPSSLPGDTGIGNLGASARSFIDFLEASGFKVWQMCPLGPTGYGDSPYQSFSAFAGNPYFIDLDPLVEAGLIDSAELVPLQQLPQDHVDYGELYARFWTILRKAHRRFKSSGAASLLGFGSLELFCEEQAHWLEDFSRFLALKDSFDGKCWLEWPEAFRFADRINPEDLGAEVHEAAEAYTFYQYLFYAQLGELRRYASERGLEIMGDLPIFVALDSADVWAHPDLFQLKADGRPECVAGVPPDYFSDDGQLWGNPLYDWKQHEETGFDWWIQRVRSNLDFYDIVRLDHFRGFESYWSVPGTAQTAKKGQWFPCPGLELFKALKEACPDAKLVAEDLGVITNAVNELREATGLPGMAVLHFAFGGGAENAYLPHNHVPNQLAYSGTHDNDTSCGWYRSLDAGTADHVRRYLGVSGDEINWDLIRSILRSPAGMAIAPLQDFLGLGAEGRLNRPGSAEGNWQWRFSNKQLDRLRQEASPYLEELIALYGR